MTTEIVFPRFFSPHRQKLLRYSCSFRTGRGCPGLTKLCSDALTQPGKDSWHASRAWCAPWSDSSNAEMFRVLDARLGKQELFDAIVVNPYDEDAVADAIADTWRL